MENPNDYDGEFGSSTQQAMLAAIVNFSQDAIISKSLNGTITSWNIGATSLFGFQKEEMLGQNVKVLLPDEKLQEEVMILSQIAEGKYVAPFKTIRKRKSGELINVSLSVSPIFNLQGKIIGASKIARNITEQVNLEDLLQRKNLELQQLNLYKDEFVGLVAHELNTPLTTIIAYLQMIRDIPDKRELLIERVEKQAKKMQMLLAQSLDIARSQSGKLELLKENTEIDQFLQEAVETVQIGCVTHKINFRSDTYGKFATVDAIRMGQVITNILTNAIKYSAGAKTVEVESQIANDILKIRITDFGNGISPTHIKNVFNRFYRVKDESTTGISGLGMGLHIARQIVELHKGKIWVESVEGRGSTFFVEVPIEHCP